MVINLEPRLEALENALVRGALIRLDRDAKSLAATTSSTGVLGGSITGSSEVSQLRLQFQFNPETVTRTRTGQWDPRTKRQGAKIPPSPEVRGSASMGSSALLAESETIGFKIVFDATEAVLAGRKDVEKGVLPQLAFLEVVSQGREGTASEDPKKRDNTKEIVQPIRPDELLLVLGSARIFPVVLTSLTIVEQKFLPTLVPLRAEAELKLTVLEPVESRYSSLVENAFKELQRRRTEGATAASSPSVADAVGKAVNPS